MVMVMNETLNYILPKEFIEKASSFMTILEALGWALLIYVVFNIINFVINRERKKELIQIHKTLLDIKKLLIKQTKKQPRKKR